MTRRFRAGLVPTLAVLNLLSFVGLGWWRSCSAPPKSSRCRRNTTRALGPAVRKSSRELQRAEDLRFYRSARAWTLRAATPAADRQTTCTRGARRVSRRHTAPNRRQRGARAREPRLDPARFRPRPAAAGEDASAGLQEIAGVATVPASDAVPAGAGGRAAG